MGEGVRAMRVRHGFRPGSAEGRADVPRLLDAVRLDLRHMAAVKGCTYPSPSGLLDVLCLPGTWAVLVFRLASTAHHRGLRPLSRLLYFLDVVLFGAELQPGAVVQPGLVVPHPVGLAFAGGVRMGRNVLLLRNVAIGGIGDPRRPGVPVIGDDVVVFDSAGLFGPVHVGDRSMIGRGAVVVDDVEPDVFVYGDRKAHLVRPLAEMGLGTAAGVAAPGGREAPTAGDAAVGPLPAGAPRDGAAPLDVR